MSVCFILPVRAGSGGAHSVVQEAVAIHKLGVRVAIVTTADFASSYQTSYDPSLGVPNLLRSYHSIEDLAEIISDFDFAIATIYNSVFTLKEALSVTNSNVQAGYYVQDYEPLFSKQNSKSFEEAKSSYTAIDTCILFSKTNWLCSTVSRIHGVYVHKVQPSIDHEVYFPNLDWIHSEHPLSLCAMVRFGTPRRAPIKTLHVLETVINSSRNIGQVNVIGCNREDVQNEGYFVGPEIKFHGHVRREHVASLLRSSDIFLDLSDYQAFGRTAVEAMASGCIPIAPVIGGAPEYITDGVNGFLVDTTDAKGVSALVSGISEMKPEEISSMKGQAINATTHLSAKNAAISIYSTLLQVKKQKEI